MQHRLCVGVALVAACAGTALGQSRSSFFDVDSFSGVTISKTGPLTFDVSLSAAPTVTYLSTTYAITDLFGFWSLRNADPDFTTGSGASFGVWDWHRNTSGDGDIAGWKTNPNTGIVPGGTLTFTYTALSQSEIDNFGVHIRVDGTLPFGGNTFHAVVPTPGALALLGVAGLVAGRRRR